MAGYSSRSLPEKLGIGPGTSVVLLGGPPGYRELVAPWPPGAVLRTRLPGRATFIHQFTRLRVELEAALPRAAAALTDDGMLWVSWPKQSSRVGTDLTEDGVRAVGLPLGLVDVKVCAVDEVWSGLKFVRRVSLRGSARG
jgi:hypothetical protein